MPKSRFQNIVFTIIMVFFMVYSMTVFNISNKIGELDYQIFLTALKEMYLEYVIVFCLIYFIISPLAKKLAFRVIEPKNSQPIVTILAIQCFTVCLIVPTITLISTFIHNGITYNWFVDWLTLAAKCFPVALLIQIFFVGPLVRLIFRTIFRD